MKVQFRDGKERSEFSALLMVVAVLTVGALAKSDVATPLLHLAH